MVQLARLHAQLKASRPSASFSQALIALRLLNLLERSAFSLKAFSQQQ